MQNKNENKELHVRLESNMMNTKVQSTRAKRKMLNEWKASFLQVSQKISVETICGMSGLCLILQFKIYESFTEKNEAKHDSNSGRPFLKIL